MSREQFWATIGVVVIIAFVGLVVMGCAMGQENEYSCDWVTPFNKVITDLNAYGPKLGAGIRDVKLRAQLYRHIADLESCPCF